MTFIEHLKNEHRLIERALDVLRLLAHGIRSNTKVDPNHIRKVLNSLETILVHVHHVKEETLLFPALSNFGNCSDEKPECVTCLRNQGEWKFMELIASETMKIDILPTKPVSELKLISELVREHQAASHCIILIQKQIDEFENNPINAGFKLIHYIDLFSRFMKMHIRSEENCFFLNANKFLSNKIQLDLLVRAIKIEDQVGQQIIVQAIEDLFQIEEIYRFNVA